MIGEIRGVQNGGFHSPLSPPSSLFPYRYSSHRRGCGIGVLSSSSQLSILSLFLISGSVPQNNFLHLFALFRPASELKPDLQQCLKMNCLQRLFSALFCSQQHAASAAFFNMVNSKIKRMISQYYMANDRLAAIEDYFRDDPERLMDELGIDMACQGTYLYNK